MFSRYGEGMRFGNHVDGAVRQIPGTGQKMRTDLSATIFLAAPESYEGGELTVENDYGVQRARALRWGHGRLHLNVTSPGQPRDPRTQGRQRILDSKPDTR